MIISEITFNSILFNKKEKVSKSMSLIQNCYLLTIFEIFNTALRPIICECMAIFCIPIPIELIPINARNRSKKWLSDFNWLTAKFVFLSWSDFCTSWPFSCLWNVEFVMRLKNGLRKKTIKAIKTIKTIDDLEKIKETLS